jgi:hypothetical protein
MRYPTPQTFTTNRSSGVRQSFLRMREALDSNVLRPTGARTGAADVVGLRSGLT